MSSNPQRTLQINNTGDVTALGLDKFSGEVFHQYRTARVMFPRHRVKEGMPGSKGMQFVTMGKASAVYHQAGQHLITDSLLSEIAQGERFIRYDRILSSSVFLDRVDEMLAHFEARSEYAEELGRALAEKEDQTLIQLLIKAARTPADQIFTGSPGGAKITDADANTSAQSFIDSLFAAKQLFDEKGVPEVERFCVLTPAQHTLVVTSDAGRTIIDRDYNAARGDYAMGTLPVIAGFELVSSNRLPTGVEWQGPTNVVDTTNRISTVDYNDYTGDFSNGIVAVCWQKQAIATARLMGLNTEVVYEGLRRGSVVMAELVQGHGILRPECAVEIATS